MASWAQKSSNLPHIIKELGVSVPSSYLREITVLRISSPTIILSLMMSPLAASAEGMTGLMLEFGQPRTLLKSIIEEKPQGAANFAFRLADRLALNPARESWPYLSGTSLTFTPLLQYDRNVNNGFKGDTIYIWGLPFAVDEASKAVEAVTAGAAIASGLSFGIAKGTTLSMSGRAAYQRAIGKEFEVFNNTVSVNLGYTSQSWEYLNAGILVNEETRGSASQSTNLASITAGKILGGFGDHLHDVSMTLSRIEENSTWQNKARIDWTGAFEDYGVFKVGLERGQKINGTLLPKATITTSYSNVIFGAATTLSVYYGEKTGGNFFGVARDDKNYQIRADRKVTNRVNVFVSYENKNSTIDSFDESGVDLGFNITGFEF
jgi:hypothetical protein